VSKPVGAFEKNADATVSRYPFLDRPATRHPVSTDRGEPCAADLFTTDIGGLSPIAQCGRTSLQSLRQIAFSARVVEAHEPALVQPKKRAARQSSTYTFTKGVDALRNFLFVSSGYDIAVARTISRGSL
jgi:hypothetical protein